MRWAEEVVLLREEMHRVAKFLAWQANWWVIRGCLWDAVSEEDGEGLAAYVSRQAALRSALRDKFLQAWEQIRRLESAPCHSEVDDPVSTS